MTDLRQWISWLADRQQREYGDFMADRVTTPIQRCACGLPTSHQWDGSSWCDGRCQTR